MASLGAVSAEPPGEEVVDGEVPREQARIELSTGRDVVVSFNETSTELKLQFDEKGKIRIFGVETGQQSPFTFERPGSFELVLAQHRRNRKFDFFRLPGEIRNRIYSFIYPEQIPAANIDFRKIYPFTHNEMMDRMSTLAVGRCQFHSLSDNLRLETVTYILRSINFHARGDKLANAFLKSLGPSGRAQWEGAFGIDLRCWAKDGVAEANWRVLLTECKRLLEIHLFRHPRSPDNYSGWIFASSQGDFHDFLVYYKAKFPRLKHVKIMPHVSPLIRNELLCFLRGDEYDGERYKIRKDKTTITKLLLNHKIPLPT